MPLAADARNAVAAHWAATLGCGPDALAEPGLALVVDDSAEVSLVARGESTVAVCPGRLADRVRAELPALLDLAEGDADRAADLLDAPVEAVLGPQFLGYADRETFAPLRRESTRLLDAGDVDAVAALEAATPDEEWQRAGLEPVAVGDDRVAGSFADGTLAAVATWQQVREGVAGLGVAAHPERRGVGHAKAAVSRATRDALDAGVTVAEYRTLERWAASVGLATDLGYRRWGRSRLIRLAE